MPVLVRIANSEVTISFSVWLHGSTNGVDLLMRYSLLHILILWVCLWKDIILNSKHFTTFCFEMVTSTLMCRSKLGSSIPN